MRYSHQRELILREVLSRSDYPTAEQICTSLRAVCPRLSLGTVYRDLNTLVDIVPEDYSLTVFGLCDECAVKAAKENEEL